MSFVVNNADLLDDAVDERGIVTFFQQPNGQIVSPFIRVEIRLAMAPCEDAHPLRAGRAEALDFLLRIEVRAPRGVCSCAIDTCRSQCACDARPSASLQRFVTHE